MSLLKVQDQFLITRVLTSIDIERLLVIVHPQMWNPWLYKDVQDKHRKEVLDLKIQDGVKFQLCYVPHQLCKDNLCDRLDASTASVKRCPGRLQMEQLRRYGRIRCLDYVMFHIMTMMIT